MPVDVNMIGKGSLHSVVPSLDDFHARYPDIDLILGVSVVARHEELRAA